MNLSNVGNVSIGSNFGADAKALGGDTTSTLLIVGCIAVGAFMVLRK